MRVSFIRFCRATQIDCHPTAERPSGSSAWSGGRKSFCYFTVFTVGWVTGARTRIRNLQSLRHVEAYLRKLNEGGWLSDHDFKSATDMVNRLGLIE